MRTNQKVFEKTIINLWPCLENMHRVFTHGLIIVAFHFCIGFLGTLGNDFGNFQALDMSQFTVPLDGFRIEGTQTIGKIITICCSQC